MNRALVLTVALLLPACSSTPAPEDTSSGLPRDLSREAASGKMIKKKPPRKESSNADAGGDRTDQPAGFVSIGALEDPVDATPGYADVRSASLEQNGSELRVILEMAGALPDHAPGDSEVVGLAVDLATDKGKYQLFASGENDGWFGYFDTPKGMKPFPGSFTIAGNQVVFTVPWSALGGPRRGRFSAYCEWSSAEGYSEDPAPDDLSKVPFG